MRVAKHKTVQYDGPTHRWTKLKPHDVQRRAMRSTARFNVVPAGRRSGKTEILGKRKVVIAALNAHRKDIPFFYRPWHDPRFFVAAPTRDQVKRIYWNDLKALVPSRFIYGRPNESQLMIQLINGSQIWCLGMDRPERIEGTPWDGGVLDEYGNMKKEAWPNHVRPSLSDRKGWCDFIGVPEGRNHYYDLYKYAKSRAVDSINRGYQPIWDTFHWTSATVLDEEEINAAREDMDELTFQQEYEASFVNFVGRAYWAFTEDKNEGRLKYDPNRRIDVCFDFNVSPGVAVIIQEQWLKQGKTKNKEWGDGIIGEIYIPRGSNTRMVAEKFCADWRNHRGEIYCYGDYTGNQSKSSAVRGSDWEIIRKTLYYRFHYEQITFKVKPNPRERERVNSVNSRCRSLGGKVRLMVDPSRAPKTIKDFEGVQLIEGGAGEIDKKSNPELTHLTDAIGYRCWIEYPIKKEYEPTGQKYVR